MATYTPYFPITVASNLRFLDSNGIPVTAMFPVASTQALDNPQTGYISHIGSRLSEMITTVEQINTILVNYNSRISTLEASVLAIQTSGVTFQIYVNGGCLNGNTSVPIATQVTSLTANTCDYNTILGTPTELALSVAAQCANLNTLPAFSQNSAMAGLAGWVSNPSTIADSDINKWLSYCDVRTGVANALAAVTPTCAQVIVDYAVTLNSQLTFNLYFDGYSFIPTGYTDNSSIIKITDTAGNIYQTSFNIVTASTTTSPVVLLTSGSALSPTSTSYTVQVTSKVINSTLGTSCQKDVFKTVSNSTATDTATADVGSYSALTSGSSSVLIVSGLSYTPGHVSISPKNSATSGWLGDLNYSPYLSYVAGGAYLNFLTPPSGTLSLSYASFRQ